MKNKKGQSIFVALAALCISFLNMGMTCCLCGHMHFVSFPGSLIGALAAWFAFLRGKDKRLISRVVIHMVVVVTTIILLKNIGDILWWGHDAILR